MYVLGCMRRSPRNNNSNNSQVLKVLYHYLVGSHTRGYWRDTEAVYENNSIKLYWDQPVQVVSYCPSNRPDIDCTMENKRDNSANLIDVSIPRDSNLHSKFCEKIAKYSDFAMLMKLTYHLERVVILPITISITGLISSELKATLQSIVEDADVMKMISKLQKAAL